eukprot:6187304-Pleurochrysis_carterae.AAC.3
MLTTGSSQRGQRGSRRSFEISRRSHGSRLLLLASAVVARVFARSAKSMGGGRQSRQQLQWQRVTTSNDLAANSKKSDVIPPREQVETPRAQRPSQLSRKPSSRRDGFGSIDMHAAPDGSCCSHATAVHRTVCATAFTRTRVMDVSMPHDPAPSQSSVQPSRPQAVEVF